MADNRSSPTTVILTLVLGLALGAYGHWLYLRQRDKRGPTTIRPTSADNPNTYQKPRAL